MNACAIVIGINDYQKPGIPNLFGAVGDAADFADWALDPGGGNVRPEHMYFWTSPAPAAPSARLAAFLANPTVWTNGTAVSLGRPPRAQEISDTALMMSRDLRSAAPANRRI